MCQAIHAFGLVLLLRPTSFAALAYQELDMGTAAGCPVVWPQAPLDHGINGCHIRHADHLQAHSARARDVQDAARPAPHLARQAYLHSDCLAPPSVYAVGVSEQLSSRQFLHASLCPIATASKAMLAGYK